MHLVVHKETIYRYSEPTRYSIQYLRLTPQNTVAQNILNWRINCPADLRLWRDGFNNIVHVLTLDKPHTELAVTVVGEVVTFDTKGILPEDFHGLRPTVFLRETELTQSTPDMIEFAESFRATFDGDRMDGLNALMAGLNKHVSFRPGESDIGAAGLAFAAGRGLCQDHAHIFIGCCRLLGVPARYVSGFIGGENGKSETDMGQAWAEAHVPGLGWAGFDSAHGVCPDERYIRLATGLDYQDAAPVRALRRGGGDEEMSVSVRVQEGATSNQ